jgi:Xaa-Pro aminopeptidase
MPVFSNFLLNFFSAFSMFSPSFTGTTIILKDKSALWTDSRYFIQATKQLEGSGIELMKEKMAETPSISEYILQNKVLHLGMDYRLFSVAEIQDYKRSSIELVNCSTLIDEIWNDRPSLPDSKAFLYSEDYAGTSPQKKIENIRKALKEQSFDSIMLCALDEIAWTLNIRGNDVHDVPVVTSFLFITTDKVIFFIDTNKLEDDTRDFLLSLPIEIQPYDDAYLDTFKKNCNRTLIDAKKTNFAMYESIPKSSFGTSPVSSLKAIRNSCEIKRHS